MKVRGYFFDSREIPYEEHSRWFRESLGRGNRAILLAYRDDVPVGVIRFDLTEGTSRGAEIDIYVAPQWQGKGLGKKILLAGERWIQQNWDIRYLTARVKDTNRASRKMFKGAGFNVEYAAYGKVIREQGEETPRTVGNAMILGNKRSDVRVLLTCVGSQVQPSVIEAIRDHPRHRVQVVGVDHKGKGDAVGASFADEFYRVPMGSDPAYIDAIEDIVRRREIRVILPASDEEALALSKAKDGLRQEGCLVACSDYEVTSEVVDKFRAMSRLTEQGVPVAAFHEIHSLDELESCAKKLGFPGKPFVIKPKVSRGGRGFRVVREEMDAYQVFMNADATVIDFEGLKTLFQLAPDKVVDFMVMEYLPGRKYSADVLVKEGKMQAVVVRNKLFPVGSPTQLADIVFDQDVIDYARSVMDVFGFDHFVQFEIGRDGRGNPRLIEINPRLDATLPICLGIGINFYHEIINGAVDGNYSERVRVMTKGESKRFVRYWQHRFIS